MDSLALRASADVSGGWAYERPDGKGRGFGTTGAHYHHTWDSHDWRTLILNAIAWTSGIEIPKKGVPSKPNPVKGGGK